MTENTAKPVRMIDQRDIRSGDPATWPAEGDCVLTRTLTGYRLVQDRPYECQRGCVCGDCGGREVAAEKLVRSIVPYMDNSTEAYFEDGTKLTLEYPHGDACY